LAYKETNEEKINLLQKLIYELEEKRENENKVDKKEIDDLKKDYVSEIELKIETLKNFLVSFQKEIKKNEKRKKKI